MIARLLHLLHPLLCREPVCFELGGTHQHPAQNRRRLPLLTTGDAR